MTHFIPENQENSTETENVQQSSTMSPNLNVEIQAQSPEIEMEAKEESQVSLIPKSREENTTETEPPTVDSTNQVSQIESLSPEATSSESEASDSPLIPTEKPYEYLDPFLENETEKYCSDDLSLTEITTVTVDGESTADEAEELNQISIDGKEQFIVSAKVPSESSDVGNKEDDSANLPLDSEDHEKAEYEDLSVPNNINPTLEDIPSFGNTEDEYLEDVVEEELVHLIQSSDEEDLVPTSPAPEADLLPPRTELSTLFESSGEDQGLLINEPDHVHVFFRITYFDSKF